LHPPPPAFQQTDPDFDPQFINPVIDEPMSPNTAAIWMALIQFTEPGVGQTSTHMAEQTVFGTREEAGTGYAAGGYGTDGMVGHGMRAPLSSGNISHPSIPQV
jgi:hypothetical protein